MEDGRHKSSTLEVLQLLSVTLLFTESALEEPPLLTESERDVLSHALLCVVDCFF